MRPDVFGNRVSAAKAREIERKPPDIANSVYGDRLGNPWQPEWALAHARLSAAAA